MSRIIRLAPQLSNGGLIGDTEGPESYLRELDTFPSKFARATGGTETVISQNGKYYRVHTFTDTDPTSLLLNFDGSNGSTTFTDDSGWGHAVTANGDAQISTTQSKFGGSSLALDGNGDGLTGATTVPLRLGGGDFTAEWWMYFSSLSGIQTILSFGYTPSDAGGWAVQTGNGNGKVIFYKANAPTSTTIIASDTGSTVNAGQWYHIAIARSSGTLTIYRDGVSVGSGADSTDYTRGVNFFIGGGSNTGFNNFYFNGYIDSLRIVKGQALYTSAFTPPTQALTRVGSGSLTFTRGGAVEYLVVGGGGGGGSVNTLSGRGGGGGGAGGFRNGVTVSVAAQNLVSVGGKGSGGFNTPGESGSSSSLMLIDAAGGGGGGKGIGLNGGSGGGGYSQNSPGNAGGSGNTPAVTPSQGNDGGLGISSGGNGGGGGGGGASAVGADAVISPSSAGNGGDGTASTISGSSVTYAGGGGGGSGASTGGGSGGSGGGGTGGNTSSKNGTSGTANTGGGGGGASSLSNVYGTGGSGGSGIVIARYRITQAEYGGSPLLDIYSGAAAAYSLRSLSSSYTGPVVTVRRSSDDAEADFTASEVAGGALATWVGANDGFVTTWYNQAGDGNLEQSTAANQPKIVASGSLVTEGGKPALSFDGSNDSMTTPGGFAAPAFSASQYLASFFVTAKTNVATYAVNGSANLCNIGFTGTNGRIYFGMGTIYNSGKLGARLGDGTAYNSSSSVGTDTFLLSGIATTSSATVWLNGSQEISITPTTGAVTGQFAYIGGDANGYWNGVFQELIFYNDDLSTQRTAIENDISQAYGI